MRAGAVALLVVAALAVYSLMSGAAFLDVVLPGGLPLGNALAALGFCCPAGAAVLLSQRDTRLRKASLAALVAAAGWLPVSIVLADNLALNFGNGRGSVWLVFSVGVFVVVFGTLGWALVAALVAVRK